MMLAGIQTTGGLGRALGRGLGVTNRAIMKPVPTTLSSEI